MRPSKAILGIDGGVSGHVARIWADVLLIAGYAIEPGERTVISAAVRDDRIVRLGSDERTLAECDFVPVAAANAADRGARAFEGTFVLRRAKDVERKLIVEGDVIILSGRLIVDGAPVIAVVHGDGRAAVV